MDRLENQNITLTEKLRTKDVLNGFIYNIGGYDTNYFLTNTVQCYNIENNKWELKTNMIRKRKQPGKTFVFLYIFVCDVLYMSHTIFLVNVF